MKRGQIWWADLPEPVGSGPGFPRPVLIIQSDAWNQSGLATVIVAAITSNLDLADAPGNVKVRARGTGLKTTSVVNVSQLVAIDRELMTRKIGSVDRTTLSLIDMGLRRILGL